MNEWFYCIFLGLVIYTFNHMDGISLSCPTKNMESNIKQKVDRMIAIIQMPRTFNRHDNGKQFLLYIPRTRHLRY